MSNEQIIQLALVDDSVPMRHFLAGYLATHSFNIVIEADNGEELLARLDESGQLPDICLVDGHMPVMDGFETARRVKEKFPFILVAGYSFMVDEGTVGRFTDFGADGFISKESSPAEVAAALRVLYSSVQSGGAEPEP